MPLLIPHIAITMEVPPSYTRWKPLTEADADDIVASIADGISLLEDYIAPKNFKSTFKPKPHPELKYDPDWWRYRGVRMNFAVLQGKYLVCYKCNRIINYKTLQDLTRHLHSFSHHESCEIFHSSKATPAPMLKFPVAEGYCSRSTHRQLFNCPFVEEFNLKKELTTTTVKIKDSKTKVVMRNRLLDFYNKRRVNQGLCRLEELPDNKELLNIGAGFSFVYDTLTKSKNKQQLLEPKEETKELPTNPKI